MESKSIMAIFDVSYGELNNMQGEVARKLASSDITDPWGLKDSQTI